MKFFRCKICSYEKVFVRESLVFFLFFSFQNISRRFRFLSPTSTKNSFLHGALLERKCACPCCNYYFESMEKHHKLRRPAGSSIHACNICGIEGHQAMNCLNGNVDWGRKWPKEMFQFRTVRVREKKRRTGLQPNRERGESVRGEDEKENREEREEKSRRRRE